MVFSTFTLCHENILSTCSHVEAPGNLLVVMIFAAQLERTKKVVKYINSLMLEAKETNEGSGFIFLKVLQL